ncbi:MAG: hypothetical protein QOJ15_2889 [Bradyrhizobium sp.]|jgi:hypothetical protein|nr:hypothetical protein [Bradyrhizobium sp.]
MASKRLAFPGPGDVDGADVLIYGALVFDR